MAYESGNWLAWSQYNGLSDSFLLTCGGIELVAWHPKTVGIDHSAQIRHVQINSPHLHLVAYPTESNLQSKGWKSTLSLTSPPPPLNPWYVVWPARPTYLVTVRRNSFSFLCLVMLWYICKDSLCVMRYYLTIAGIRQECNPNNFSKRSAHAIPLFSHKVCAFQFNVLIGELMHSTSYNTRWTII